MDETTELMLPLQADDPEHIRQELELAKGLLAILNDPAVRLAEMKARERATRYGYQSLMEHLIPLQPMPLPTARVFYGHLCLSTSETPKTSPPSDEGLMVAG